MLRFCFNTKTEMKVRDDFKVESTYCFERMCLLAALSSKQNKIVQDILCLDALISLNIIKKETHLRIIGFRLNGTT